MILTDLLSRLRVKAENNLMPLSLLLSFFHFSHFCESYYKRYQLADWGYKGKSLALHFLCFEQSLTQVSMRVCIICILHLRLLKFIQVLVCSFIHSPHYCHYFYNFSFFLSFLPRIFFLLFWKNFSHVRNIVIEYF